MKTPIYILLLLLSGCSPQKQHEERAIAVEKTIKINADDAGLVECEKIIEIESLIPLGMKEGDFIGTINKVLFTENSLIILDKKTETVFIFDRQGNFLSKISRKGRGPEEYQSMKNISLTLPNTINIVDNATRSIKKYTFEGEFIGAKTVEGWPCAYREKDNYEYMVLYSAYLANSDDLYYLNIQDKSGNKTGYFPFMETVMSEPQSPTYFFESGEEVYYHQFFDDNIYSVQGDKLVTAFKIDFGEYSYPTERLLKAKTFDQLNEVLKSGEYVGNIFNILCTKDFLHFLYTTKNGGVNTYVLNLKTNNEYHYTSFKTCKTGISIAPIASDGTHFYSVINPWELSEKSLGKLNKKYGLALTNDPNSNELVLVKYHYK